jgi:hypothetical protein
LVLVVDLIIFLLNKKKCNDHVVLCAYVITREWRSKKNFIVLISVKTFAVATKMANDLSGKN